MTNIEEARLTTEEINQLPVNKLSGLPSPPTVANAQLEKAIPIITKQVREAEDYDPQAEMFSWFLEHGWTPPAELDAKIKQAQEDERKRLVKILEEYSKSEHNESGEWFVSIGMRPEAWQAITEGKDPSQEGGE